MQQRRSKRREDELLAVQPANIMFDRRVVRGNTYASRILPAEPAIQLGSSKATAGGAAGDAGTRRAAGKRRVVATPDPVEVRRHMDVQTDVYLEELTDVVPETDNTTQTDAFLERPPTPKFVPAKSGTDAATQIEEGELFDFDTEVEPLLEVLVGKVLEQALCEVLEEEELEAMRQHQQHFEAIRAAELVAAQRLEAAERRKMEEKERRLKQERERNERERAVRAKVAACAFARGYLGGIVKNVFQQLQDTGYFYDPVEREVELEFLPWLTQQALTHLEQEAVARAVLQQLVADAVAQQARAAQEALDLADAQAAAAEAAAAKHAAAVAAAAAAEQEELKAKATLILTKLQPLLVSQEQIEAARTGLSSKAAGDAEAAFEAEKAQVGEARRAELEAQLAAAAEAAAAAAAEAEANGEEPPEHVEPQIDIEAEVEAAMAAVKHKTAADITDADVLSALLEQELVSKQAIVEGLALHMLSQQATPAG